MCWGCDSGFKPPGKTSTASHPAADNMLSLEECLAIAGLPVSQSASECTPAGGCSKRGRQSLEEQSPAGSLDACASNNIPITRDGVFCIVDVGSDASRHASGTARQAHDSVYAGHHRKRALEATGGDGSTPKHLKNLRTTVHASVSIFEPVVIGPCAPGHDNSRLSRGVRRLGAACPTVLMPNSFSGI